MKATKKKKLPPLAREFLSTHSAKKFKWVLRAFHCWMTDWKIGFKDLRRAYIESFIICPRGRNLSPGSQVHYRRNLAKYLMWLYGKELLRFDPRCFLGRAGFPLPETASRYIRSLEPTHKNSTLNGYRTALRGFHRWLDDRHVSLDKLLRRHTSAWLGYLSDLGLAPKTINHRIILVRRYLHWLYEQGILTSYPDDLIRVADMPKIPKYLPRPLPPAADKELQERLAESDDIYFQGLLLMRRTGLRIGELRSLEKDCVRHDNLGNRFLKVPLGKLNSERLVPLDDSTTSLIYKLRGSDEQASNKTFLIETKAGKKTQYPNYIAALKEACEGLDIGGKMVPHRLRHSFATSMLNAGMSLVGVMKLLGHTDHRMTLRYAEITQETVIEEYFQALLRLEHHYSEILNDHTPQETDPAKMLSDVVHLIQNLSADDNTIKTFSRSIIKRIQRIQTDIQKLFPKTQAKS